MAKKKKFNIADNKLLVIFVVVILAVVAWNVYQQIPRSSAFGIISPGGSIGNFPDDGITPIKADLTATLDPSSPPAHIVIGDAGEYDTAARYSFVSVGAGFVVDTLSIKIPNSSWESVKNIKVGYKNKLGLTLYKIISVSGEKTIFKGLSMYVAKNNSATLTVSATYKEIGVDPSAKFGAPINMVLSSGITPGDFHAVADNNFVIDTKIANADIYSFEHRLYNSSPIVWSNLPDNLGEIIPGGLVDLYKFKVRANVNGAIAIKKFTFEINITDASTSASSSADLRNFTFVRNGTDITTSSQITMVSNNGTSYVSTPLSLENDSYPLENGNTYWVQVAFGNSPATGQEQSISPGEAVSYAFRAQAGVGFATGDSIVTRLLGDSTINSSNEFAYLTDLDFHLGVQQVISLQNSAGAQLKQPTHFVWSDSSSVAHSASFDDDGIIETSSRDWTQGYLVYYFPLSPRMLTL